MCFLHSIPGAGQISSSFSLFCSIFPIFHKTVHPTQIQWLYIINLYMHTVDITVLCSCRVLASMYTHYNTILCSRVNLTGKSSLLSSSSSSFFYSTISILINPESIQVYNRVTFYSVCRIFMGNLKFSCWFFLELFITLYTMSSAA